jgi:hypothetical protein
MKERIRILDPHTIALTQVRHETVVFGYFELYE